MSPYNIDEVSLKAATVLLFLVPLLFYLYRKIKTYSVKTNSLYKDPGHSHYWICDETLWESYNTNRGLRSRYICDVIGQEDNDNCEEEELRKLGLWQEKK